MRFKERIIRMLQMVGIDESEAQFDAEVIQCPEA